MDRFKSVEEILDFAIDGEQASYEFYTDLAAKMETPVMKKVFEDFAKEELGHKAKLQAVKQGNTLPPPENIAHLEIANYLVNVKPTPDMNYPDALILAMKKEKASYRLYLDLAAVAEDEQLTDTFLRLAEEEAKHKLRFEIEYDDLVLKDN